ncbi:MAG: peroxidase family protein [Paracoccaceae bacterium]
MATLHHGLSRFDLFSKACAGGGATNSKVLPNLFGRLFGKDATTPLDWNGDPNDLIKIYVQLMDDMKVNSSSTGAAAQAGMTFFGQFIDHDITLDATSAIGTRIDPRAIRNVRTPNLDMDCVYGDGPEASPHLYGKIKTGDDEHGEFLLFGREENNLDLARTQQGTALIGDPRNDENIFVSQIQGAFICLHNILMAKAHEGGEMKAVIEHCSHMGTDEHVWSHTVVPQLKDFEAVRRFIRLHYQWLILKRFLPSFVTDKAISAAKGGAFPADAPIMPVEFSVAGFRFGHATVQPTYRLNPGDDRVSLFKTQGFGKRPTSANVNDFGALFGPDADRARPVGLGMANELYSLPFVSNDIEFEEFPGVTLKDPDRANLGLRNILRDRFAFSLMSGQQMSTRFGTHVLPVTEALEAHGITRTPLWYYCLEEAEKSGEGKLDGAGGIIVAGTIINLLRQDPMSVYHIMDDFVPYEGFGGKDMTMSHLLKFVEQHRDIPGRDQLYNG